MNKLLRKALGFALLVPALFVSSKVQASIDSQGIQRATETLTFQHANQANQGASGNVKLAQNYSPDYSHSSHSSHESHDSHSSHYSSSY
jgi:hypothetical protein